MAHLLTQNRRRRLTRSETVSKIDVAKRQLSEAIRLFFERRDPISVHTLVGAAHQVLYDLARKRGITSHLKDSDRVREEYRGEWIRAMHAARNFFKHADEDPGETFDFNSDTNPFLILDALDLFQKLTNQVSAEGMVFVGWFYLAYPNLLKEGYFKQHTLRGLESGLDPDDFWTFRQAIDHPEIGGS